MARKSLIVSTLVFLLLVAAASADIATDYVWFEAVGLNPQSGVSAQGVEGGDLGLSCDTSGGPAVCQWRVQLRVHVLAQQASMGTDLLGDTSTLAISDVTHGDFPGAQYANQGHNYQTPNTGGLLADLRAVSFPIDSNSQYVPSQGAPGFYNPVSFTLTASKLVGEQGVDLIDARVNSLVWAHVNQLGNPPLAVLGFGDAPLIPGNIQGGIAAGVIQIQSIPEPATGALLVLSAVCVFRRRRSA